MMKHKFVEFIPAKPEEGILYISVQYKTATHLCACGCGEKVITPFSPVDWTMSFNGETVSLSPSIGNWRFACKSHYFIRNDKVEWAGSWDKDKINACQSAEIRREKAYLHEKAKDATNNKDPKIEKKKSFFSVLLGFFSR